MNKELDKKVAFDFIRYANCWEDADILLEGLSPKEGSSILSIGSAGDNSFSLLSTKPEKVVAVDVNPIQLYLIELKKACIKSFDQETTIGFLGFKKSGNRLALFNELFPLLSEQAQLYWVKHFELIEKGVIHQGKFEHYFQMFVKFVLPFIHNKRTVEELFREKSAIEQKTFYDQRWNNWRWRTLFKVFFSKLVMGRLGRDPQFLKEVKVNVGSFIFDQAEQELSSTDVYHNHILRYNLTGNFGDLLPHYLRIENYDVIRSHIDSLYIHKGFAEDAIQTFGKFDSMNLSNIFEYMNPYEFQLVSNRIIDGLNQGARLAYWNLMVPRRIDTVIPDQVSFLDDLSFTLTKADKGFFYRQFIVNQML